MRWTFFAAWLALLVGGGLGAMVFWSSFNRVVGGSGTSRDWIGLGLGLGGVAVTLLVARWVLMRIGGYQEVEWRQSESTEEAGGKSERSVGYVQYGKSR